MTDHVFTSTHKGLTLQDSVDPKEGSGVWAQFVDGVFTTDDDKVAARLRRVDNVTEVPAKEQPVSEVDLAGTERVPLVIQLPAPDAPKAKWAAYALGHGMVEAEVKKMSAKQLAEHFATAHAALQDSPGQAIEPAAQTQEQATETVLDAAVDAGTVQVDRDDERVDVPGAGD